LDESEGVGKRQRRDKEEIVGGDRDAKERSSKMERNISW
jgi:hypothetical protein